MKFALITEGVSEHRIIKHILAKYFKELGPEINQIQPKLIDDRQAIIGGWNEVLKYCERNELNDILIENDFLVIQIDTDQSQTSPFDINHFNPEGQLKTPEQLYADVILKLQSLILPEILTKHRDNILFAVCIHTIECWLLPIYYNDSHKTKTTGCIDALNIALARQNKPVIPIKDKNGFNGIKAYNNVLQHLKGKTDIIEAAQHNFGFKSFVNSLGNLN